ncbi:MAG: RNA polymerase sigma factor [Flavobacteriaceae bacterium]|nr:RNA polymerase sigma factor [Flavobacteriaceae bacterium]
MKTSTQIDALLVLQYQKGDKKVLSVLVSRWHKRFCKLAYWYCKDADVAKDIAQECWVTIFNKLHDLKDPKQFKSWAISIVNRRTIDWLRKQKREQRKLDQFYNQQEVTALTSEIEKSELLFKLSDEISKLPENQRVVIQLFYLESYSLKQMAEVLNISVGTAKSRLFHARERLKLIINIKNI